MDKGLWCALLALFSCSNGAGTPAPAKLQVEASCSITANSQFSASTGRKGRYVMLGVLVALEGTEVVTKAASPDIVKEAVGDKTPMRQLLSMHCTAFLPETESLVDGLKDERESSSCDATLLDLHALEAGKPFSMLLSPRVARYWKIRAISPSFGTIEVGEGEGENLRISGVHRVERNDSSFDTQRAHISWDYSPGGGGAMGSSRVELAADCPTF